MHARTMLLMFCIVPCAYSRITDYKISAMSGDTLVVLDITHLSTQYIFNVHPNWMQLSFLVLFVYLFQEILFFLSVHGSAFFYMLPSTCPSIVYI